jgi:hypothetical protein
MGLVFGFRDGKPTNAADELQGQNVHIETVTTPPVFESDDNGMRGATEPDNEEK